MALPTAWIGVVWYADLSTNLSVFVGLYLLDLLIVNPRVLLQTTNSGNHFFVGASEYDTTRKQNVNCARKNASVPVEIQTRESLYNNDVSLNL